jgi:hypothetical protein
MKLADWAVSGWGLVIILVLMLGVASWLAP